MNKAVVWLLDTAVKVVCICIYYLLISAIQIELGWMRP